MQRADRREARRLKTVGEFVVSRGHIVPFVLTYALDAQVALNKTETFWRRWANRCVDRGEWTPAVPTGVTVDVGLWQCAPKA